MFSYFTKINNINRGSLLYCRESECSECSECGECNEYGNDNEYLINTQTIAKLTKLAKLAKLTNITKPDEVARVNMNIQQSQYVPPVPLLFSYV
jgi:membrane protease subunit (stomatin/prohibitin family)